MTSLPIPVRLIMRCAAAAFSVSLQELRSLRRNDAIVHARMATYLLARELTELSFPQIGRVLGRDHSTIMHGARVAARLLRTDATFAERVEATRLAILAIARSEFVRGFDDPDAVALAERICADPLAQATRVSVNDISAMAIRLLNLEDVAGAAFQLLLHADELAALPPGPRAAALRVNISTLTETLSGVLTALGYAPPSSEDCHGQISHQDEDRGRECARAAE